MDLQTGIISVYVKAELHQCLIDKIFPRVAAVLTASELQKAWPSEAT
jgi:hypothetical protein